MKLTAEATEARQEAQASTLKPKPHAAATFATNNGWQSKQTIINQNETKQLINLQTWGEEDNKHDEHDGNNEDEDGKANKHNEEEEEDDDDDDDDDENDGDNDDNNYD